jgi:ribonuclease HIII
VAFGSHAAMPAISSYTVQLNEKQILTLRESLKNLGYEFREVPYAHFGATKDKVNLSVYKSGKCVIQGKGTEEFVQFFLEPTILGEARLGYEHVHNPEMFDPRIGVDESGKGDYFGPLVVAGVYLTAEAAMELKDKGIKDSKQISSDKRIGELADVIRHTDGVIAEVLPIGNEAYNRLQKTMGNVNSVLGWGHARVIENILEKLEGIPSKPVCTKAIADQFGNERIIKEALMKRGRQIKLVQRHKAESDLAVAAASIIAREGFVRRLMKLSREHGVQLPKGASVAVEDAAKELVKRHGPDALEKVAKLHFRTTEKVLGLSPRQ